MNVNILLCMALDKQENNDETKTVINGLGNIVFTVLRIRYTLYIYCMLYS